MKLFRPNLQFLLITILFAINGLTTMGQEGSPFLTNFTSDFDESLTENYSICNDRDGVLIIANRKGILSFDAEEWKLIKTPELPLVVAIGTQGNLVYVGCRNNIGFLRKNLLGEYEYVSIAGKEAGVISQIAFANHNIYFLSQTALTRVSIQNFKEVQYWKSKTGNPFNSLLVLNDKVLVDVSGVGLQMPADKGMQTYLSNFSLNGSIIFSLPFDENNLLIGASDNKCYLFNGKTVKNFQIQDQQYLSDGIINDGKILDKNKVVISTVSAGCLVFELKTGKTVFTVNYQTGLPDDEIYALGIDRNHGIWLAHNQGLSRIDAEIPVKNYTNYKGLNGNLSTLEVFNDKLFVGTGNGVYVLEKKKDYIEFIVKQPQVANVEKTANQPVSAQNEGTNQNKETKKGFLGRLFSKKQKSPEAGTSSGQTEINDRKSKSSIWNFLTGSEKQVVQKKVYHIASVSHIYTKIPGFDHKCKQLLILNGKLIAVTISGIFEVSETRAVSIIPNVEANFAYAVPSENSLYICTNNGIKVATYSNGKWQLSIFPAVINEPSYSFAKDIFGYYWIGIESKVYKVKLKKDGTLKEEKTFPFASEYRERAIVRISNKKPVFFLSTGIYSIFNDSIQPNLILSKYVGTNTKYYFTQQEYSWIRNNNKWISISTDAEPDSSAPNYLNLFDNINQIYSDKNLNLWIINENTNLSKIDQKGIANYKSDFSAFIKRFSGLSGESFSLYGVDLNKSNRSLKIHISAPYFIKRNSNQYQYIISGQMTDWNEWSSNPEFNILLPKSGKYELKVRAKNIFGNLSNEQTLSFNIKKPFYEMWWFYLLCIAAGLYIIYLFIKYRERTLQKEKEILEQKVQERTHRIAEQKEQIELQYNALALQNEKIEDQSNKIAEQNREIKDSIYYAKRLQTAVMPDSKAIEALLSDYFVLFRPKDIVSGDFYWIFKKNEKIVLAVVDCTGHGVPGGFLSMLGISFLNEISIIDKNFKANELLNLLKARMKSTLIKEGHSEDETRDGMDIALCIIDQKANKMQYAGANNPIYMIRKKELIEYKPDKMPIGTYIGEKKSFTNNEIELQANDVLYLFSDGYKDQLGGPDSKRIKSTGFRELLINVHDKPMKKQKEELEKFFDNWMGEHEQTDDILIFGLRI
jgi:serine phosphatase RsbU (regulator of sigma subunit)/ligand-binding sensor domain-containing protein